MNGKHGVSLTVALGAALMVAGPATSQIGGLPLPDLRGVGALPGQVLDGAARTTGALTTDARRLLDLRDLRIDRVLSANRLTLDRDPSGDVVVRGQVLALSPDPAAIDRARALGFMVLREAEHEALGVRVVTLATPRGMRIADAVATLRRNDPQGSYEYDHLYFETGAVGAIAQAAQAQAGSGPAIGLIDGGVDTAVVGGVAEQRGFAGAAKPSAHGTAVASLLRRSAPGARLYVADIYGASPQGGSVSALASALNWMATVKPQAVNVSLVGPPNRLLEVSVQSLAQRGVLVVAAVGNDGPAAPPAYPASYPQVISVTGVDKRHRVLAEAGKPLHLDFAAPGADLTATGLGGAARKVRGTSFAAPIVAGRLAVAKATGQPAVERVASQALDLGAKGPDPIYGRGVVGVDLQK